jgi:outer membrane protein OmpA-like peptidoglycan-associated protein
LSKWFVAGFVLLLLLASGCTPKQAPAPPPAPLAPPAAAPQPKQSLVVLLPEVSGKPSGITVTNSAGTQAIAEPYQAIRVERPDAAPSPPFAMDQTEVRRVFGSVLDALPAPELAFTLYFAEDKDALAPDEQAEILAILKAIQDRKSTAISVIGHTDTTATSQFNYQLGLRRAQGVAAILRARGVDASILSVESHGDADQAVKTARGVAERRNRRVEVIVR